MQLLIKCQQKFSHDLMNNPVHIKVAFTLTVSTLRYCPGGTCTASCRRWSWCSDRSRCAWRSGKCFPDIIFTHFYLRRSHAGQWMVNLLVLGKSNHSGHLERRELRLLSSIMSPYVAYEAILRLLWPQRHPKWLLEAICIYGYQGNQGC